MTYGQVYQCENCMKSLVRGSAEDNMTELCNECLEQAQMSMVDTCDSCGARGETQEGVCSPCGYKMYK